jgi:hypothetical protein
VVLGPFIKKKLYQYVTGSLGSNPEHVDYEMLLFILVYKLGFMSTTSGLRNWVRKVNLERTVVTTASRTVGTCRGVSL